MALTTSRLDAKSLFSYNEAMLDVAQVHAYVKNETGEGLDETTLLGMLDEYIKDVQGFCSSPNISLNLIILRVRASPRLTQSHKASSNGQFGP